MAAVIEARGLGRSFGEEQVLENLDLTVGRGEIFGLIGPSGAGKSTLLRTLTGHLLPSEGEVEVLGGPPSKFTTDDRRRIGFMPQGFVLYEELSVQQNLAFVAGLYGLGFGARRQRLRETLEFVGLWDHRRKTARNISGGMQRRLQLAAATVHEPELLFVDEPTANLDPLLRHRFWEEFGQLRDRGRTLFVTTQYISEAELCDRVGLLAGGRLVAVGTPRELRRQAFGGDLLQVTLAQHPSQIGAYLKDLEAVGHVVEVREESGPDEEALSRIRITVDDADAALARVARALREANVRSVDVTQPAFDDVFFRLLQEPRESAAG